MGDASTRGWGAPGSGQVVTPPMGRNGVTAPGGFRVEVAPLFVALVDDLEDVLGEAARPGWCWGRAVRKIRGSSTVWSNHAWGLAFDFNAPLHPLGAAGTMSRDASEVAARYGMRWGGDYLTRPDEMHFEFMGTPSDAKRLVAGLEDDDMKPEDWQRLDARLDRAEKRIGEHVDRRFDQLISSLPPDVADAVRARLQPHGGAALGSEMDAVRVAVRRLLVEAGVSQAEIRKTGV